MSEKLLSKLPVTLHSQIESNLSTL